MERKIILTLLVGFLIIVGLSARTAVSETEPTKESPCLTEACVLEAAHLLKRMNTSVDPCDDFYEFACGRYIAESDIPDDKSEIDPLSINADVINNQVKKVIAEKSTPGEIRPFTLLKKFYKSCMNTKAIENDGIDQMKAMFSNLGGWPILEQNNWAEISWIEVTKKLRQYGFVTSHFIAIDSDINPKNSSEYIISVDQAPNEEVADENLKDGLEDHLVSIYADFLIDLVVLFGVDREYATKEVNAVISFRSELSKLAVSRTEHLKQIIAANETNVATAQKDYPTIPWLDLINGVLAIPSKTISDEAKVVIVSKDFLTHIEKLLNTTPKRVLANHALLQVLRASIHFLPKSFRDREQKFMGAATGVAKALPRTDICIAWAVKYLSLAVDALYVRKYVDQKARTDVTQMVSDIKRAFINILKEVDWMDKDTKSRAIEKAEHILAHVAYPVELMDDKELVDYYIQMQFNSDHILPLSSEVAKFKRDKELRFYGGPVVKIHWTTRLAAITSNAVYDPQTNTIQIPSGIMQNEFYNNDRPHYMNYGALGMVIGHELTHGFDDTGKAFDKDGNSANWWEPTTLEAYTTKANCFVKQYGNFSVPEINSTVNGESTLGENMADNGGMKEAYLAYLEWITRNKEELPLPGVNYTAKQLFWISIANAWCTKIRPAALEQEVLSDEHSPARYRILGGFSNMENFIEDFKCPLGSNMNSGKRCEVW